MVDCAGMDYHTQTKMISTYRGTFPMYSDSGEARGRPRTWECSPCLVSQVRPGGGHIQGNLPHA